MTLKTRTCIIDTETNSLTPDKIHCLVLKDINTLEVFKFKQDECLTEGKAFLESEVKQIIGHNIIGFDIPFVIDKLLGIKWDINDCIDTFVLSRLLYSDRFKLDVEQYGGNELNIPQHLRFILRDKPHSLEAYGIRFNRYKPKIDNWDIFSEEMLHRCVEDVEINFLAYQQLMREAKGFSQLSIRLEHRIAQITWEQTNAGVFIDRETCTELYRECKEKADVIREELKVEVKPLVVHGETIVPKIKEVKVWDGGYEISPDTNRKVKTYTTFKAISQQTKGYKLLTSLGFTIRGPFSLVEFEQFNPDSSDQRLRVLNEAGWRPVNFNKPSKRMIAEGKRKGNPKTTDEENLSTLPDSCQPGIKKLASYVMLTNRWKLALSWLELSAKDGKIHGYVNSCGTPTGRMTHDQPNCANIPSVELDKDGNVLTGEVGKYGWECRKCFSVENKDKYCMVGFDASSLEVRMLAHYMNDNLFTHEILNGDIYTKAQHHIGLDSRKISKAIFLALMYGAGDAKLGSIVGGNERNGKLIRSKVMDFLPELKRLIDRVQRDARSNGYLVGLDGRKLWVRKSHAALNTLLQSAGAIVMKMCLAKVYKEIKAGGIDAWIVLNVHDEYQFICDRSRVSELKEILVRSIRESGKFFNMNIDLDGTCNVGSHWGETH